MNERGLYNQPGVRAVRCCNGIREVFDVYNGVFPCKYKIDKWQDDHAMYEKTSDRSTHDVAQHLKSLSNITHTR